MPPSSNRHRATTQLPRSPGTRSDAFPQDPINRVKEELNITTATPASPTQTSHRHHSNKQGGTQISPTVIPHRHPPPSSLRHPPPHHHRPASPTIIPASPTVIPASPTVIPASPTVIPASPTATPASPTVIPPPTVTHSGIGHPPPSFPPPSHHHSGIPHSSSGTVPRTRESGTH